VKQELHAMRSVLIASLRKVIANERITKEEANDNHHTHDQ